jgi:phosphodiesterase/alkaline phosphatase D-like protein
MEINQEATRVTKRTLVVLVLISAFSLFCAAQSQSRMGTANSGIQITNGPGVDNVTGTSVVVFWNTNLPSGAVVKYGTDEDKLNQTAMAPSGQTDHKVNLSNLQPDTTYFFQVTATEGRSDTAAGVKSGIGTFKTKPKNGEAQKY